MRNNAIVFPKPNDELKIYMMETDDWELDLLDDLVSIKSKSDLEKIRDWICKIVLREKWSSLWKEIQRVFREYSMIYSDF